MTPKNPHIDIAKLRRACAKLQYPETAGEYLAKTAVPALLDRIEALEGALQDIDAVGCDFGHFEAAARTMKEIAAKAWRVES